MNPVLQSLFDRKSVRAYTDEDIPREVRDLVLDAAIQAPSAGNQMQYTILEIEDQSLKEQLAVLCDNQPFIARAPWVLVFLADPKRWTDAYRAAGVPHRAPGPGDLFLASQDTLIAAQNAVTAAESLGIGSCYIGDILENREEVGQLLNLHDRVVPVTMLVFGYPTEGQKNREKPARFHRRFMVRKNRYSPLSDDELRDMYADRNPDPDFDFSSYVKAFCKHKYMSDFALEMNQSVGAYFDVFIENGDDSGLE